MCRRRQHPPRLDPRNGEMSLYSLRYNSSTKQLAIAVPDCIFLCHKPDISDPVVTNCLFRETVSCVRFPCVCRSKASLCRDIDSSPQTRSHWLAAAAITTTDTLKLVQSCIRLCVFVWRIDKDGDVPFVLCAGFCAAQTIGSFITVDIYYPVLVRSEIP